MCTVEHIKFLARFCGTSTTEAEPPNTYAWGGGRRAGRGNEELTEEVLLVSK